MVSLKYETQSSKDCISLVTGQDLCFNVNVLEGLVFLCLTSVLLLLSFKNRILKTDTSQDD